MEKRYSLYIIIALLVSLGLGGAAYKIFVLGFSLWPTEQEQVWTVEAKVNFEAHGDPATVSLNLPDSGGLYTIVDELAVSTEYGFRREEVEGATRGIWTQRSPEGDQTLYYRAQLFKRSDDKGELHDSSPPSEITKPEWEETYETAANALIEEIRPRSADAVSFTAELLRVLNLPDASENVILLTQFANIRSKRAELVVKILETAGIPARLSRGIFLEDGRRGQKLTVVPEVFNGEFWEAFDLESGAQGIPENFLYWAHGDQSLIEVTGGSDTEVRFSTLSEQRAVGRVSVYLGKKENAALIDFSIFSLPIESQNTFKILLMIPLGAFVVVIIRNLIGLRTSGTFMPILIAMAFIETTLLTGLVLFLLVVSVGLVIRSYLSRLDLLLVPRISAVLVVVIILFVIVSVTAHKLGIESGLGITLFPMIIVAWTIERMSILWEEEGAHEVLIQGGGSLITAIAAYWVMSNRELARIIFLLPELLLVVLAVILMIGNYTGYRLTELRRFEPMGRD